MNDDGSDDKLCDYQEMAERLFDVVVDDLICIKQQLSKRNWFYWNFYCFNWE